MMIGRIAALALLVAAPASAQTSAKTYGDWAMRCEKACVLVQSVADQTRPEVAVTIVALKIKGQPILRIVAPLGVLLPAGVGLKIDQAEMGSVGFLRCTAEGCVAEAELSPDQVAKLSAGQTATFSVMTTPAEGVAVPVSLKGFKDGFSALPAS